MPRPVLRRTGQLLTLAAVAAGAAAYTRARSAPHITYRLVYDAHDPDGTFVLQDARQAWRLGLALGVKAEYRLRGTTEWKDLPPDPDEPDDGPTCADWPECRQCVICVGWPATYLPYPLYAPVKKAHDWWLWRTEFADDPGPAHPAPGG